MFGFGKRKRGDESRGAPPKEERKRIFTRLRQGLASTRAVLNTDVSDLIRGLDLLDGTEFRCHQVSCMQEEWSDQ